MRLCSCVVNRTGTFQCSTCMISISQCSRNTTRSFVKICKLKSMQCVAFGGPQQRTPDVSELGRAMFSILKVSNGDGSDPRALASLSVRYSAAARGGEEMRWNLINVGTALSQTSMSTTQYSSNLVVVKQCIWVSHVIANHCTLLPTESDTLESVPCSLQHCCL